MIKIVIEDYVAHLSDYELKLTYNPELLQDQKFQFNYRIHIEFAHLYHWHPMMPNEITVASNNYSMEALSYNNRLLMEHELASFFQTMISTPAGQVYLF